MKSVIGTGKTIEQAIENALLELNATKEQVTIKVISEGGFFKKAQVEVTLDEVEKKTPIVSFDEQEESYAKEKDNFIEDNILPKNKKGKKELVTNSSTNLENNKNKINKKPLTNEPKENKLSTNAKKQTSNKDDSDKTIQKVLESVINEVLKYSKGENIELGFEFENRAIYVNINGSKLGALIGTGGEALNSFESYLNAICMQNGFNKRVRLDIGGYKKEKEKKLITLAEKAYQMALVRGSYKLEPMPARERRIIHTTLQNKDDVTTISKGIEPKRFVIVEKKSI